MSGMKLASEQTLSAARALRHTGFPTVYFSQGFCMVMEDFTGVLWGSFRFRVSLEKFSFIFFLVFSSVFSGLYKSDKKTSLGASRIPAKGHQRRLWVCKSRDIKLIITFQHGGRPQSTAKVAKNEGSDNQPSTRVWGIAQVLTETLE